MKTPVTVSLIILGAVMMATTLFLDYRQHETLKESLGLGIGFLMVAVACIFSERSSANDEANETEMIYGFH